MNKKRILLVEDSEKISHIVKAYLEKEDFKISIAYDGETALEIFNKEKIHLVILDLMIPKISGEEVCLKIRNFSNVPIIMLTAKSNEDDKVQGFSIGADDYLTKPFSPKELVHRVKALIRRTYRDNNPLAEYLTFNNGDLEFDFTRMIVKKRGSILNLTSNEFKILKVFLSNPGQVFSRELLVEKAFGVDYDGFDRTIDTHIKNIRHKIENNSKKPIYILTIYGMGYKFGGV